MTTTAMTGNIAAGSLSDGSHTVFIPEIWSAGVLKAIEFAAVLQKRVTRDYEGEIKKGGDTVHVNRLSNLTAVDKTKGYSNTVVFEAITEGQQNITIAYHQYAAFLLEHSLDVQANSDLRKPYEQKIGYALARSRDVVLAALVASLSQYVGTLGVEMTSDDYLTAQLYLAQAGLLEQSANPGEDFAICLTPGAYNAALKVDVFINKNYNQAANAIQSATVGEIYGFPVLRSNLLTANGAGHDNLMMHKGCFALCVQDEVPVESQHMIEHLGDAVVGHNIFGVAELNYPPETAGGGTAVDNRGVWLKTL
ncbi:MAG: hypothetical protein QG671_3509 [Actinomycetota bacterium]|nr:hypothetical protein [Actinomycetota bacterium]